MSYWNAGEGEVPLVAEQCIGAQPALVAQRWKQEKKQLRSFKELSPEEKQCLLASSLANYFEILI